MNRQGLWEKLKGSELVWDIQQYFGIRRANADEKPTVKSIPAMPNGLNGVITTKRKSAGSDDDVSESDCESRGYIITNWLWYYLFSCGAAMGDEAFYAAFFTFWFWNVDGAVGRRVITVWAFSMYIGQSLKDIIRWARPSSPPVVRLEKKWELEYGMPSTHAMVGVTVPLSIVIYTANRYEYPLWLGVAAAIWFCSLVCASRIYLGMHSVLDVIVGVCLAAALMFILVPLAHWMDQFILSDATAMALMLSGVVASLVYYPSSDRWTPARGDTAVIMGTWAGIQSGSFICSRLGLLTAPVTPSPVYSPPPYPILWPTYNMLGLALLRTVMGLCMVLANRAIFKSASYGTLCLLLHLDTRGESPGQSDDTLDRRRIRVELSYKFITYVVLGFNVICLSPAFFRLLGIERPTFHTEV